jgi:ABC-2 type transport system ATP-binding protein
MDDAIVTRGLSRTYGSRRAVDGLSLRVRRGEIYGFLGLNGAGKTTTIRMLLGMIAPTSGSATLLGERVHASATGLWARVGYLVEVPHAYPQLTVRESLEIVRRLRHLPGRDAVDRIIERLGLGAYADTRAGQLSLGNRQRLGLARALLHEPELLILDEPANGLDPAGVVEVRELLLELATREGVTIFMSSHILSEVSRLVTRVGIVHEGRLLEEIDVTELERRRRRWIEVDARDRSRAAETLARAGFVADGRGGVLRLHDPRACDHPDALARMLVDAGTAPTRLSVEQEDLESYFLRLIGRAPEAHHA